MRHQLHGKLEVSMLLGLQKILRKVRKIEIILKKAVKSGTRNVHEAYKRARNEVNKLVKNTKTKYFMNALSENNQNHKTMWNTIRTLTNKNSKTTNITEIHVENDHSVTEPKQIADAFNTFFINI
ncbi:Hypothetical predicted protein, partial [Paramuricea clavata]